MEIIQQIPQLKPRRADAHKGDFGKIYIIAGSVGMAGAAALAGRAALRAGAGLVRVATAKSVLPTVASIEPSFTTIPLAEDKAGRISDRAISAIVKAAGENDVIAFGPGVGISRQLRSIAETVIRQENLRLVIDADGLNNLSKINGWVDALKAEAVLTPHPGEMKRLWGSVFREPLPADRQRQAVRLAKQTGAVVVLKGAGTVVSDGAKIYINKTGNAGMATAGAGDSLTGIIASLMGQGLGNLEAAVLGVYVHGLAGDLAAESKGRIGLIATDIIDSIPEAFIQASVIGECK